MWTNGTFPLFHLMSARQQMTQRWPTHQHKGFTGNRCTYLSTSVLMTASVSSTKLSTFCFFLLGSWGPRPLRGGLTGSLGRLLLASPASTTTPEPWSSRLACPRVALDDPCWWSSKSLSSRHTQLLPMVPVLETTEAKVSQTVGTEFEKER